MGELSWRTRLDNLQRLSREEFDVLVIGGGITGAGLALDAALRGLQVALVEKRDFASGTSSRSTKLLHGGLRYLEHFDFAMVREGLRERATMMKIAPHLAEAFPFLIPIYQQSKRNYDHPLKMRLGLWLYDLLAAGSGLKRHKRMSRTEALQLAPQLDPQGLTGALVYYDGLTNDSRLVMEVLKSAAQQAATISNYTGVSGFICDPNGRVAGARLRDGVTGDHLDVKAKLVINATGVWMDDVLKLKARNPATGEPSNKVVRPSKGIHLTVSAERFRVTTAWLIPALTSHRFYFIVPWQGRVNIGTTDTDYHGDKDSPCAKANEVQGILAAINAFFPEAKLQSADVISVWAGLRPLIGDTNAKSTTDVSRKEVVIESADGLISIAGGKLTTYRLMAERGMDLAVKRLNERFQLRIRKGAQTSGFVLQGGRIKRQDIPALAKQMVKQEGLSYDTALHLLNAYGSNASTVAEVGRENERLRQPIIAGLPHIFAEVVYAARYEMALTLTDVMARRTRLLMLAGEALLQRAPLVAEIMAKELNWNESEIDHQLAQFESEYECDYVICG
jgi:glycerol-3-phosphate dehydrogenase